jgi:hypothetical protein
MATSSLLCRKSRAVRLRPTLPRCATIFLTLVVVVQDIAKTLPLAAMPYHVASGQNDIAQALSNRAESSWESANTRGDGKEASCSACEPAGLCSLPEGSNVPQRQPTELEPNACQPSVPKEPLRGRLDRAVVLAANEQLNLPMGSGRVLVVHGQSYLFCLEPHYHPPGYGLGPEGWHKGVTVYHGS